MKIRFIMASVVMAAAAFSASAGSVDGQGMPVFYLRGDFGNNNWGVQDAYRFTRDGDVYTFTLDSRNAIGACRFKIANDDWTINYGAEATIDASQYVTCVQDGPNIHTSGMDDAVISFTYTPDSGSAVFKFVISGVEPGKVPVDGLSGTLPVLYINVYADESHTVYNNEIISKDLSHKNYFEFADYWLDTNGCEWMEELGAKSIGSEDEPLPLQIKARGNWTRIGFAKKPFKLKLDKKQSLLGLSKSKHFALLAHADDNKGYLRNFTGFNLGRRIGLPWTPSQQPVEVVINGNYRGLYFLTESIRIDEDRVNITELGDDVKDPSLVSGGYIVELDNYDEDTSAQIQMEEKHCSPGWHYYDTLRITFDTPEVYSDIQRWFITNQFEAMNDYVGANDDRLWSYLDLDDAARYYLVNEIVSHTEAYHGSTYLFRDFGEGQKWHFSPLWDFGNAFNGYTDEFFYNCDPYGNTWIPSMRENKKFNDKVKDTWLWFMSSEYKGIEDDIDEYIGHLAEAAKADHERWKASPVPDGGIPVADNRDLGGRKAEVIDHLNGKINWLKSRFGDFTAGAYPEPDRDDTPAARLPEQVTSGIDGVFSPDTASETEFYSLQGVRIKNPVKGQPYIIVRGNQAVKAIAAP